jgi:hypothetical protein
MSSGCCHSTATFLHNHFHEAKVANQRLSMIIDENISLKEESVERKHLGLIESYGFQVPVNEQWVMGM